jgi:hypothetical protein
MGSLHFILWELNFSMWVTRICFIKTMTLTQGHPYLVIMTFIYVSLWYTVWYYGSKSKHNCYWPLTLIMQKRDHFWLLRHHYSESPVIPLSNDIWYRCVAHGFRQLTSKWPFLDGNWIFQCEWLVFASLKQWPWPKVISIYVIMTDFYGIIILIVPSFLFPMTYDIGV